MSSEKVNQLQVLQQNMQNILLQKQQIESQMTEVNSALSELKNTDKAYKILGKVMLATSKEDLTKDLTEKKEVIELRLKTLTTQEESLKKNMEELQKEVMAELSKEKKE